jgi:hypothetical protein
VFIFSELRAFLLEKLSRVEMAQREVIGEWRFAKAHGGIDRRNWSVARAGDTNPSFSSTHMTTDRR